MTIQVHGCKTMEMTPEENAQAEFVRSYFQDILVVDTHLLPGDLKVEFAKMVALPAEEGVPARRAPGETFYVMEISAGEKSRLAPDTVRQYLFQMAFNAGAGSLRDMPPVLQRHIRGDLKQKGGEAVAVMFNR